MSELSLDTMRPQLRELGVHRLTTQEERYIQFRNQGINPVAAARAAGYKAPVQAVAELAEREDIQKAIAYYREVSRAYAISCGAIEFTKDMATTLYLEAHAKSATATEEIKAVDSLVKLHGLAAPEKREVSITRQDQLEELSDEELLKFAGQEIHLTPADYTEIK